MGEEPSLAGKCCGIVFILIAAFIWEWYVDWSSNFLIKTDERISPSLSRHKLDWNYSEPLTESYIIDQHYLNIIETVLLRRPWTDEDYLNVEENKMPPLDSYSFPYTLPVFDYRCVIGGDIYYDSRYISKVRGPYIKSESDSKQNRSFIVEGYAQAKPFQNNATYQEICPEKYSKVEWDNGEVTKFPFKSYLHFEVEITEKWELQRDYKGERWNCNRVIFEIKDYMSATNHYLGDNEEELRIYPGRSLYAITPGERWSSFHYVKAFWGIGHHDEYPKNRYKMHTITRYTTYS